MQYKCIATGSKSNCHLLTSKNGKTLILDCGVTFKELSLHIDSFKNVDGVIYTHKHNDHYKGILELASKGIKTYGEDSLQVAQIVEFGEWQIFVCPAYHDVPCISLLIHNVPENKFIYFATDTYQLPKIKDMQFDLMLLECNYINELVDDKIAKGILENTSYSNHMSLKNLESWLSIRIQKSKNLVLHHLSSSNANPNTIKNKLERYTEKCFIAQKNLKLDF